MVVVLLRGWMRMGMDGDCNVLRLKQIVVPLYPHRAPSLATVRRCSRHAKQTTEMLTDDCIAKTIASPLSSKVSKGLMDT